MRSSYGSPVSRLFSTVRDGAAANECWEGTGKSACRKGYFRQNYWIPGLGRAVKLTTHVLAWIANETGLTSIDELYLAYLEVRYSGLEIDHRCVNRACRNPQHLSPMTHQQNVQASFDRRGQEFGVELGPVEF